MVPDGYVSEDGVDGVGGATRERAPAASAAGGARHLKLTCNVSGREAAAAAALTRYYQVGGGGGGGRGGYLLQRPSCNAPLATPL